MNRRTETKSIFERRLDFSFYQCVSTNRSVRMNRMYGMSHRWFRCLLSGGIAAAVNCRSTNATETVLLSHIDNSHTEKTAAATNSQIQRKDVTK